VAWWTSFTFGEKNPGEWGDYALENKESQGEVNGFKSDVSALLRPRPNGCRTAWRPAVIK
jgi:hypothetical protein